MTHAEEAAQVQSLRQEEVEKPWGFGECKSKGRRESFAFLSSAINCGSCSVLIHKICIMIVSLQGIYGRFAETKYAKHSARNHFLYADV